MASRVAPSKIQASHILAKHSKSRNPSSWREATITRSPEEALAKISAIREAIVSGKESFEEIAARESDCSSAKRMGDLGFFGKHDMVPEFSAAAFALQVGDISEPVSSASGIHIIKRTA
jgi:NIMA-interacting peptidyl-prolyl cis-trans isomerase 1